MSRQIRIATTSAIAAYDMPQPLDRAVDAALERLRGVLAPMLHDRPDLVMLPECCDQYTGAETARLMDYYAHRGDRVLEMLAGVARQHRCFVTCPTVRQAPDGTWRNSVQLIDRKGDVIGCYNKNHPVICETTDRGILAGREAVTVETEFGRVGFAICFDLNFEPLRVQCRKLKPDLLLFCSMYHGGLMQAYWAYDLRCHFAASVSALPSAILNPLGETVATTTNYTHHISAAVNLDCAMCHLDGHREKLAQLKARYGPEATVRDPGLLGSVLVTSESDQRTAAQLLDEAGIEPLDAYFARSLAFQRDAAHVER